MNMAPLTIEQIRQIPKVELHCHFEGSVQVSTLMYLQQSEPGAHLNEEQMMNAVRVKKNCRSLVEFLEKFDTVMALLQTKEQIEYAACQTVLDAAADGIVYLELRLAPMLFLCKGLKPDEVMEAYLSGIEKGMERAAITVRTILIAMRGHTERQNLDVLALAQQYRGRGVAAIDLAGDEISYPPFAYASLFLEAKRKGIPYTIHAGESGTPEYVKEALALGASRIGHGVQSRHDGNLVSLLRQTQTCLELCFTSNLHTSAVQSWDQHPIRDFLDKGLCVSVNTDDPAISGITLSEEFWNLNRCFGFSYPEFKAVSLNAVRSAFADEETKSAIGQIIQNFYATLKLED